MLKKIMITGYGPVAKELIELLSNQKNWKREYNVEFSVVGIAGSAGLLYEENGISLKELLQYGSGSAALKSYGKHRNIDLIPAMLQGDVLIECSPTNIQTGGPALSYIQEAIQKKINIISVSKGALVHSYESIQKAAKEKGVAVKYSGATAAALPTLDIGENSLAGSTLSKIEAVLNGTSNFILSAMHKETLSYKQALNMAIQQGAAESNPAQDVQGTDSACKLLLIANKLFRQTYSLNDICIEGIEKISKNTIRSAQQSGKRIKLLCTAEKTKNGVSMRVGPQVIEPGHPLFLIDGAEKGIVFYTEEMGRISCTGGASSPRGAAAAAIKDLINMYRTQPKEELNELHI